MKTLQIALEDDLDAVLEQQAQAVRLPKSELVQRYLRERLTPLPPLDEDPLMEMVGVDDYEPGRVLIAVGDLGDEAERRTEGVDP